MPSHIYLKGTVFCGLCLMTALLGSIFILIPLFPLIFWRPKVWRKAADRLVGMWCTLPPALMEFIYGVKFYVSGDEINLNEPAIILMNHRTRLDWMYFWSVLYKMDPRLLTTEKISLKKELKFVPGAGWSMECDAFIFLDRNWEADKASLDRAVKYYSKMDINYQILLFPEGTDKCPHATARSNVYADKMGYPHYEQVLHPKTTGFAHLAKNMRDAGYLGAIYDVSIGYADHVVQSEVEMMFQQGSPESVHCHVRRIDLNELPFNSEEKMDVWLRELWAKKEQSMIQFYAEPDPRKRRFPTRHGDLQWPLEYNSAQKLGLVFSMVFWVMTAVMWSYFLITLAPTIYYILFAVGVFLGLEFKFGGAEKWIIARFLDDENNNMKNEKLKKTH